MAPDIRFRVSFFGTDGALNIEDFTRLSMACDFADMLTADGTPVDCVWSDEYDSNGAILAQTVFA